jgi:hypothetical protein
MRTFPAKSLALKVVQIDGGVLTMPALNFVH